MAGVDEVVPLAQVAPRILGFDRDRGVGLLKHHAPVTLVTVGPSQHGMADPAARIEFNRGLGFRFGHRGDFA